MLNPNTTFVCPACDVATSSTSKLYCHLERHLGQRPFGCRLCPKKYVLKFEANRHIKEKHLRDDVDAIRLEDPNFQENPIVSIRCLRCAGTIISRDDLKQHAMKHSGVVGEEEDARVDRKDKERKRPQVKDEPNLRKLITARWKCVICGDMQPDLTEMTIHLNEHIHCIVFVCEGCDLKMETRTEALRHMVDCHEEGVRFRVEEGEEPEGELKEVCRCCGDDIASLEALRKHIELHYTSPDSELAGIKFA